MKLKTLNKIRAIAKKIAKICNKTNDKNFIYFVELCLRYKILKLKIKPS